MSALDTLYTLTIAALTKQANALRGYGPLGAPNTTGALMPGINEETAAYRGGRMHGQVNANLSPGPIAPLGLESRVGEGTAYARGQDFYASPTANNVMADFSPGMPMPGQGPTVTPQPPPLPAETPPRTMPVSSPARTMERPTYPPQTVPLRTSGM